MDGIRLATPGAGRAVQLEPIQGVDSGGVSAEIRVPTPSRVRAPSTGPLNLKPPIGSSGERVSAGLAV